MAFSKHAVISRLITRIAILAVALSVSVMIVAISMINGFQNEISSKIFGFWAHIHVMPFELDQTFGGKPVDRNQPFYLNSDTIEAIDHVQSVAVKGGILKTDYDFEGMLFKGVCEDFNWPLFSRFITSGRQLNEGEQLEKGEMIVSEVTARRMHLEIGSDVLVGFLDQRTRYRKFKVAAIYDTGLEEYDKQYAFVDLSLIQQLNGWGADSVGGFEVFLTDQNLFKSKMKVYFLTFFSWLLPESLNEKWKRDPLDDYGEYFYRTHTGLDLTSRTIKEVDPNIFGWLELQNLNEAIILVLMCLVAIINMTTVLLILILDRTNMIGILKALGQSDWGVRKIFIFQAGFIISTGILIGNITGIGLCLLQEHFEIVKLPVESYYVSVAPVHLDFWLIFWVNLTTLIVCTLVMIFPTILVSKITPIKAIRFK